MLTPFDGQNHKGVDIGGAIGDPITAAADGQVIYVGDELKRYGKMIIIRHSDAFLTAYGHNATLLVKERQEVRRGQKIAEMGTSGTDRAALRFEVRRNGQPVDPLPYLEGQKHD